MKELKGKVFFEGTTDKILDRQEGEYDIFRLGANHYHLKFSDDTEEGRRLKEAVAPILLELIKEGIKDYR